MLELPPLGLYIHIPWCVRKCPYCDFNSHRQPSSIPEEKYITSLLRDFDQDLAYIQGREIESIFIGGGTPSLFCAESYQRLLQGIQNSVAFSHDIEITAEANPGSAERDKFSGYRQAGINRLSLGIQSFNDEHLHSLGRIHSSVDAYKAIEIARNSNFHSFNLDLMYGLGNQSIDQALADLQSAIDRHPQHISWYQLTIEPNTEYFKKPPAVPAEEQLVDMHAAGSLLLQNNGYQDYEVSAWSQSGASSRHNLNYWRFGDYIGIGAGAHGKITFPEQGHIIRTRKFKQPDHYLRDNLSYRAEKIIVAQSELALEFMMNQLRLMDEFTAQSFESRTGLAFSTIKKQVESLGRKELLEFTSVGIRPSRKGRQFLNTLLEEFL